MLKRSPCILLFVVSSAIATSDCYLGNGETYRGAVSVTDDGQECLNWNSYFILTNGEDPHSLYPDFNGLEDNYCRYCHIYTLLYEAVEDFSIFNTILCYTRVQSFPVYLYMYVLLKFELKFFKLSKNHVKLYFIAYSRHFQILNNICTYMVLMKWTLTFT